MAQMDAHANHGIKCSVENCKYNAQDHYCHAKQIEVGPQFASCSAETICATFQPNNK